MPIFRYKKSIDMPPKEGVKFATTYYRQGPEQYEQIKQHIITVASEIMEYVDSHPEWDLFVNQPLRGFPRLNGKPNYSINQILADMLEQTRSNKDLPSGMLGRWSRLFHGTEYDIEMLQEFTPTGISPDLFDNLFAGAR
jgi:hypothetical protein